MYLYAAPLRCDDETLTAPPWLYGTLFTTLLLELAVVINDAIITSKSCRGRIDHSRELSIEEERSLQHSNIGAKGTLTFKRRDPDNDSPRRKIKRWLFSRVVLFVFEVLLSALYGYACWSPAVTEKLLECDAFTGPMSFARAVAVTWWLVNIISAVVWLIYIDPVGLCTPGLLDRLDFLDEIDELTNPTEHDLFKFHRASIEARSIRRRLQTICCCLGLKGHQSRGLALEDAAQAMHTIFSDVDLVGSDLMAGLILLNKDQKRKKRNGDCLVTPFKKV